MHYLKSLFFSFLVIFFSLHIFDGIEVKDATKLPHLGGDLLFAIGLGFLNSLIFPVLKMIDAHTLAIRMILATLVLNFAAYALLKLLPLGISVTSLKGYAIIAAAVSLASFLMNYLEMRQGKPPHSELPHTPSSPPPEDQGSAQ